MRKLLLILLLTATSSLVFSQNYFSRGTTLLLAGDCYSADSILSLELDSRHDGLLIDFVHIGPDRVVPLKDVYFNRALAQLCMGDSTGYCIDLYRSMELGDDMATARFEKECTFSPDTVFLNRKHEVVSEGDNRYLKIRRRFKYGYGEMGRIVDPRKNRAMVPRTSNFIAPVFDGDRSVNMQAGWSGNARFYSKEYYTTLYDSEWYTTRSVYEEEERCLARYHVTPDQDTIFSYSFFMPKVRGGYVRYNDFLEKHLKYPEPPRKYKLYEEKGLIVDVPCIVTKEGTVEIVMDKPLEFTADLRNNELYAHAAMDAIKKLERVKPAKIRRKKIDFFLYIPVTFVFDEAGYNVEVVH
jgi:hypothetical protein